MYVIHPNIASSILRASSEAGEAVDRRRPPLNDPELRLERQTWRTENLERAAGYKPNRFRATFKDRSIGGKEA